MVISRLEKKDIKYLDEVFETPKTRPVSHEILKQIPQNDLSLWCLENGYYQIPSTELIHYLRSHIDNGSIFGNTAIEIGAGNGCIGRSLGIPITDNCLQERPDMAKYYAMLNQPTINYPKDIVRLKVLTWINYYMRLIIL